MIGPQPLERTVHSLSDVCGTAVGRSEACASLDVPPKLRCEGDLIAPSNQRATQQILVRIGTIHLRGVEEGASELERSMERRNRLRLIRRAVGLAHAHTTEADRRDHAPRTAELTCAYSHQW